MRDNSPPKLCVLAVCLLFIEFACYLLHSEGRSDNFTQRDCLLDYSDNPDDLILVTQANTSLQKPQNIHSSTHQHRLVPGLSPTCGGHSPTRLIQVDRPAETESWRTLKTPLRSETADGSPIQGPASLITSGRSLARQRPEWLAKSLGLGKTLDGGVSTCQACFGGQQVVAIISITLWKNELNVSFW